MSPLQSILATYRAHSRSEREKGTYFPKAKDPATGKSINDANLWATETMHNPKYPLELLLRVVSVSLETRGIVEGLPPLDHKS